MQAPAKEMSAAEAFASAGVPLAAAAAVPTLEDELNEYATSLAEAYSHPAEDVEAAEAEDETEETVETDEAAETPAEPEDIEETVDEGQGEEPAPDEAAGEPETDGAETVSGGAEDEESVDSAVEESPETVAEESDEDESDSYESDTEVADAGAPVDEAMLKGATKKVPDLSAAIELQAMAELEDAEDVGEPIMSLDEEQSAIFSYFIPVAGMERQICSVLEGVRGRTKTGSSKRGNIIIEGEKGCGKTTLATKLIKVAQKLYPHGSTKVGRINAQSLNKRNVEDVLGKVAGGYMIIEEAGKLLPTKAADIARVLEEDDQGLLIVVEDGKEGVRRFLGLNNTLSAMFTEKIRIPIFTNDELVVFGKTYALECGYTIDELGVLALYNRIGNIRSGTKATTFPEVKEILDSAMDKAEKGSVTKAMRSIFSKRYDEEDNVILREKDFM